MYIYIHVISISFWCEKGVLQISEKRCPAKRTDENCLTRLNVGGRPQPTQRPLPQCWWHCHRPLENNQSLGTFAERVFFLNGFGVSFWVPFNHCHCVVFLLVHTVFGRWEVVDIFGERWSIPNFSHFWLWRTDRSKGLCFEGLTFNHIPFLAASSFRPANRNYIRGAEKVCWESFSTSFRPELPTGEDLFGSWDFLYLQRCPRRCLYCLGETSRPWEDEMGPGSRKKGPGFGIFWASVFPETKNKRTWKWGHRGSLEIPNLVSPAFFGAFAVSFRECKVSKIHGFAKPSSWLLFLLGNCYS